MMVQEMKRIALWFCALLVVAVLSACSDVDRHWNFAAQTHVCDNNQMEKAQAEADWCTNHTGYLSTYCYGTAIIRNCKRIENLAAN
jgi:hypothetical protein